MASTNTDNSSNTKKAADEEHEPLLVEQGRISAQDATDDTSDTKIPLFSKTALIVVYYALCSSTMLIINKVAVHNLPSPTFLLLLQLASSAVAVKLLSVFKVLEVESLEWGLIKKFLWVIGAFLGIIFTNIKVLQNANVETFITFRSSTPLVMSVCDYLFLGRALPGWRSLACLIFLLGGSIGYALVDSGFSIHAYMWLALWYCFYTFDIVYVKHLCNTVPMTNWGRVYYTNLLAVPPLMLALPSLNEHATLLAATWNTATVFPIVLSCIGGLCLCHAGYLLRENVTATYYTIIGLVCKLITVIINLIIWDKHASPAGIAFLLVCVMAGTAYEQAPARPKDQQPKKPISDSASSSPNNSGASSPKQLDSPKQDKQDAKPITA